MKQKVKFKDLSGWLKVLVVWGFINLGYLAFLLILGFIIGITSY